jgi:hypothetical protein
MIIMLFSTEDGDSRFLRNAGTHLQFYTASTPKEHHPHRRENLKSHTVKFDVKYARQLILTVADGSLPCSKKPATGSYPQPGENGAHPRTSFCKIHFNTTLLTSMKW